MNNSILNIGFCFLLIIKSYTMEKKQDSVYYDSHKNKLFDYYDDPVAFHLELQKKMEKLIVKSYELSTEEVRLTGENFDIMENLLERNSVNYENLTYTNNSPYEEYLHIIRELQSRKKAEYELLQEKLKKNIAEKKDICNDIDTRCHHIKFLEDEYKKEKVKKTAGENLSQEITNKEMQLYELKNLLKRSKIINQDLIQQRKREIKDIEIKLDSLKVSVNIHKKKAFTIIERKLNFKKDSKIEKN
jgi:hypothetical protein